MHVRACVCARACVCVIYTIKSVNLTLFTTCMRLNVVQLCENMHTAAVQRERSSPFLTNRIYSGIMFYSSAVAIIDVFTVYCTPYLHPTNKTFCM